MKLAYISFVCGVAAAIFAVFENSQIATVLAVGLLLAGVEMIALTKVAGGFTAVVTPVLIVNAVLLASLLLWDTIGAESIVSVRLRVADDYQIQAAVIGITFSAAYTFGALAVRPRGIRTSMGQLGDSLRQLGTSFRIPNGALVAVGYAGIFMAVYARQGALLQGRYLAANGPGWAVAVSTAVTPLSMLVLCIAAARPGPWRWLAAIGVGMWFLILFGRASRTIAALPAMIIFGTAFASGKAVQKRSIAIAAAATVILLQLPLVGRPNPDGVGIIPLGEQLLTRPEELFAGFNLSALLGNILFSGPLTGVVANRPISDEAFWVSINPLPGTVAGWYEIRDSLRVDSSTPYNALGELGAHGWIVLILTAGVIGMCLALSTRIAANLSGVYALTAVLLVVVITVFFSLSILQYNLRSSTRLVWYALGGVTGIWFMSLLFERDRLGDKSVALRTTTKASAQIAQIE